jgi:hypothetical protein
MGMTVETEDYEEILRVVQLYVGAVSDNEVNMFELRLSTRKPGCFTKMIRTPSISGESSGPEACPKRVISKTLEAMCSNPASLQLVSQIGLPCAAR